MITTLAWLIIVVGLSNTYFAYEGWLRYREDQTSFILRGIFALKVQVWLLSLYFSYLAGAYLFHWPPLPFGGILLALALLSVELLPAAIYLTIRAIYRSNS